MHVVSASPCVHHTCPVAARQTDRWPRSEWTVAVKTLRATCNVFDPGFQRLTHPVPSHTRRTVLRHLCSNHCHNWLRLRSKKNNCQLADSLWLSWSNRSKFITDNSNFQYHGHISIRFVSVITVHVAYASTNKIVWNGTELFFVTFYLGRTPPHVTCVLWHLVKVNTVLNVTSTETLTLCLLPQPYLCPNLPEGFDNVGAGTAARK